ncbi:MAG: Lrp/AsnC family transcriptional regulator [Bacillota bacterium]
MRKMDKTEKKIMKLLQSDGRKSFVDMADDVGVTEGTIRRKFYRLVREGIIRISGVSDPFKIGFKSPAIIALNVEPGKMREVAERISQLEPLYYVGLTTGIFDIIVQGVFPTNEDLARFIMEDLGNIEGIREINTSLLLRIYKQSFEWGVALETN